MNDPLEVAFRFFQRGVGKFTNYYPGSKVVRKNVGARHHVFERTLEQTECRLTKRFVSKRFVSSSTAVKQLVNSPTHSPGSRLPLDLILPEARPPPGFFGG